MKRWIRHVYFVFIILVLIFIYIFIKKNLAHIKDTLNLSFTNFLILSILTIITITLNGNKIEILTRYYKIRLKFKEWFGLSVITTMGNYLAPLGLGMSLRAFYLKRKYHFPYTLFVTTLATSYLTSFLLYGLIGLIILTYIYIKYNFFNIIVSLLFLGIFLVNLMIIVFSPKIKLNKIKFFNKFIILINNWNKMKKDFKLLLKLTLNDLILLMIYSFRIFFIFIIISNKIPFIFAILIALIVVSSSVIGITPASIGVKEALIAYSTFVIGKTLNLGILVSIIDRGVSILYVFILGAIFSYILLRNLKNKKFKNRYNL